MDGLPSLSSNATLRKLDEALNRLEQQEAVIGALQTTVNSLQAIVYVENVASKVVHAMRPGDGAHTSCGWSVGPVRQKRGGIRWLDSVRGRSWRTMCDRCMVPERNAARLLVEDTASDSD